MGSVHWMVSTLFITLSPFLAGRTNILTKQLPLTEQPICLRSHTSKIRAMAAASLLTSASAHSLLHSPPHFLPLPPPKTIPSTSLKGASSIQYNPQKVHQLEIQPLARRDAVLTSLVGLISLAHSSPARAGLDEDYTRDTKEIINQVKSTIDMDKSDPNISAAVAALREGSNNWVAKYRREKKLAGKPSFGNMYSALNAISGHYISFGPTSPIPAKRKARIFEEVDIAEKALNQGR